MYNIFYCNYYNIRSNKYLSIFSCTYILYLYNKYCNYLEKKIIIVICTIKTIYLA